SVWSTQARALPSRVVAGKNDRADD
ncbi:uncharacterized protein METZ01_LOCUS216035, partial [marine metagenome]